MDRFVINSIVALGTGLSLVLIIGLVEFQPVGASTEGYDTRAFVSTKSADI
ncbi:hypothetical protein [Gymnodinialimonas ulvae]|uniref:hypothetical protein n=1 Tax=Gymnodinialimonas ulvae TaxID=3126504 RepID=UPI0030B3F24C